MRFSAKRFLAFLDKGGLIICGLFCAGAVIISYMLSEAPKKQTKSAAAYENYSAETVSPIATVILSYEKTEAPAVLSMPLLGEVIREYSAKMEYYSNVNAHRAHMAVDILAEEGSPVCAIADGKVVEAGFHDDIGFFAYVEHPLGIHALYASFSSMPSVIKDDPVREGDELGLAGASGLLEADSPPHLHFAVYKDGVCLNPMEMDFWKNLK